MKQNMGSADRIIRIVIAVTIAVVYAFIPASGVAATIMLIIGGILLLTGIVGFCPLYLPFRLSTKG